MVMWINVLYSHSPLYSREYVLCMQVCGCGSDVGNSSHIPRTDKYSLAAWLVWPHSDHDPATTVAGFGCR